MKLFRLVLALGVIVVLINWVRGPAEFSVLETLPYVERRHDLGSPSSYDPSSLALVCISLWGLFRLMKKK